MVFCKNHFFLSDQLWKEDDMNEGKLVNKHFTSWKYKDIEWNSIPGPNEYGYLEDKSNIDMVLDLVPWSEFSQNDFLDSVAMADVLPKVNIKYIRPS